MKYRLYDVVSGNYLESELETDDINIDNTIYHVVRDEETLIKECRWVPVTASHEFLKLNYDSSTDKYSLDEDAAAYDAHLMDELRKERDRKLSLTDWIKLPDTNVTNEADWDIYRQALRDLPSNVDKTAVLELSLNAASGVNDIKISGVSTGEYYNGVEIEIIDPQASGALSVSVTGLLIQVTLAHDGTSVTSTIQDVIDAINNDTSASALVVAALGTGATGTAVVDSIPAKAKLAGGESVRSFSWPTPPSTPVINGL